MKAKKENRKLLYTAYEIFSMVLLFLLGTFMLDVLSESDWFRSLGALSILPLFAFKVYFYSGIFGVIVEIASGQNLTFTFKDVFRNANAFWKTYLILILIPFGIHFFLFSILFRLPDQSVLISFTHFYFLVLFILSYAIVNRKYVRPYHLSKKPYVLTIHEWMVVLFLFCLDLSIFYMPRVFPFVFDAPNFLSFISEAIEYFEFIFFTLLILKQYPEIKDKFDTEKEIILISPHGGALRSYSFSLFRNYPPIFIVLRAFMPQDYRVRVFNQVNWRNMFYRPNKLVAITYYTSNSAEAYKIAKGFREAGSKVIMGGPHATYFPEEALDFCDSVLIGEAEGIWREIVRDYEKGALKRIYKNMQTEEYDSTVHDLLMDCSPRVAKSYIETVRGCKYNCHFCAVPSLNHGQIRKKPVEKIVALVKKVKHYDRNITFIDNNIFCLPDYSVQLFNALKPLHIQWRAACSVDIAKDESVLDLAKESGCKGLLIGYEIPGGPDKEGWKGKFSLRDRYKIYTRRIQKRGIHIQANFMFGFESDSWKTLIRIWAFCLKIKPHSSGLSLITPLPGSRFYYDLVASRRLTNMNWRNYSMLSMVFQHPRLDKRVVSFLFPYISTVFLFTTSKTGLLYLLTIICVLLFLR